MVRTVHGAQAKNEEGGLRVADVGQQIDEFALRLETALQKRRYVLVRAAQGPDNAQAALGERAVETPNTSSLNSAFPGGAGSRRRHHARALEGWNWTPVRRRMTSTAMS